MNTKIYSLFRQSSVAACLFLASFSQQVLAHAHLKLQTPAADARVSTAPTLLVLNFSERIEPGFSGVVLTAADNSIVKTGKLELAADNNMQAKIPIEADLAAGKYNVSWHVVSVDGHKTKGQYSFIVD